MTEDDFSLEKMVPAQEEALSDFAERALKEDGHAGAALWAAGSIAALRWVQACLEARRPAGTLPLQVLLEWFGTAESGAYASPTARRWLKELRAMERDEG